MASRKASLHRSLRTQAVGVSGGDGGAPLLGRERESWILALALRGRDRSWRVLNVHGLAGSGKTALLHSFCTLAEGLEIPAVFLDGQRPGLNPATVCQRLLREFSAFPVEPPEAEFASLEARTVRLLGAALRRGPMLLVVDRYEALWPHDRWMRGVLFTALPTSAVVVLGTLTPLGGPWREAEPWRTAVRSMPLGPLTLQETRQYLHHRGLRGTGRADQVWRWSQGHPGAVVLAVDRIEQRGPEAPAWPEGDPEAVRKLARRWLEEALDPDVRRLVEVGSLLPTFRQEDLAAVLGDDVPTSVFEGLTALSYVHSSPGGWYLESLPRRVIADDWRLRAPITVSRHRFRAMEHFAAIAAERLDDTVRRTALCQWVYLLCLRQSRAMALYRAAEAARSLRLRVEAARAADAAEVVENWPSWSPCWGGRGEGSVDFGALAEPGAVPDPDPTPPGDLGVVVARSAESVRLLRDHRGRVLGCSLVLRDHGGPAAERGRVCFVRAARDTGTAGLAALTMDLFGLALDPDGDPIEVRTQEPAVQELLGALGFRSAAGASGAPAFRLLPGETCWTAGGPAAPAAGEGRASGLRRPVPPFEGAGNAAAVPAGRASPPDGRPPALDAVSTWGLTAREQHVVAAALEGLSNAEIARRLVISELTVKKHLTQIYRKTEVLSRTQLVSKLLRSP